MKSLTKIFIIFFIVLFSFTLNPAKTDHLYLTNVHWLALNIYYESGNQPMIGKIAVGVVTLNRLRTRYSDSIEGVIKQYKQFSWYDPQKINKPRDEKTWNESVYVAKLLLSLDPNHAIIEMFDGITHFHATYVKPEWRKSMVKVTQIGDHIFYKKKARKS